jgi:hypothetical protein
VHVESAYDDEEHPAKIVSKQVHDDCLVIEVEPGNLSNSHQHRTQTYIYDAQGQNQWRKYLDDDNKPITITPLD